MKHEAKRTRDWIMSAEFDEVCTHLFTRIQRGEKVNSVDAGDSSTSGICTTSQSAGRGLN